ncbi:ABC transporter permease subunit [Burkholderiaceae bacterium FT117]|uniref:glycine betaine ABC transporter substrate-binding protein n=1 Tax=Zeimonas sediminis TaxID=2944268 RepID=UPI0023430283|nr:glycine betaine ABC transporter substrate-binding protein [Zeimonas sediminis]MCM5570605.1 ABC transporter permease subunit [Zeimonas sediminis]
MLWRLAVALAILGGLSIAVPASAGDALRIGSKRFTESYVLAGILAATAAGRAEVEHLPGMGNTAILFEALRAGSIDLYPEYLGTIELEILKRPVATGSLEAVNRELAPLGLVASVPFGFNNSYALAVRAETAAALRLDSIGALAAHPGLRFGLSHEFLGRADGWAGLRDRYRLPQRPAGLDHGLAYEALAAGSIDLTDVYSTDAKIGRYGLVVLRDELGYFPRYDALILHRADVPARFPEAWRALERLAGRIDERRMIELNAAAELRGRSFDEIAAAFVAAESGVSGGAGAGAETGAGKGADTGEGKGVDTGRGGLWQALFADDFWRLARQHVALVLVSVLCAVAVGVPAGVAAAFRPRFGAALLAGVGALQTIPSLALLALLISAIGAIGTLPALVALFAYALLPVVRNTCVGVAQVPVALREAASALGLRPGQRILLVDLPIALPTLLAGIRTAAVISVGTATIAAFIGAGGFGERIATGLALNDHRLLLAGALPSAALAFLVEGGFALLERRASRWSRATGR